MGTMLNKFKQIFPIITIILIIIGLLFSVAIHHFDYAIYGLIIASPVIIGILLIRTYKDKKTDISINIALIKSNKIIVFIFILIFQLYIINHNIFTFHEFFNQIIIPFWFLLVGIQIFTSEVKPKLILFELIIILTTITYVTTTTPTLYFGLTDLLYHLPFSEKIVHSGFIITPDITPYAFFPLYHIFLAVSSLLGELTIYSCFLLVPCLVYSSAIIILYCIIRRLTENDQIALLTCLLFVMNETVIFYAEYMVPRSLAFVGFLMLILLILFINTKPGQQKERLPFLILLIVGSIFLLLVHSVTLLFTIILLILLFLCNVFVENKENISYKYIIFLIIISISYWLYIATQFSDYIFRSRLQFDSLQSSIISVAEMNAFTFSVDNFNTLILLIFSIFGFYCLINTKKKCISGTGMFCLFAFIVYSPNPLRTIQYFSSVFLIDTLILLVAPFVVFAMAFGLFSLLQQLQNSGKKNIIPFIILCLSIILYGISLNALTGIENRANRYSFNADEIIGLNFGVQYFPSTYSAMADYYTSRFLSSSRNISENVLPQISLHGIKKISKDDNYVILMTKQFLDSGLSFNDGAYTYYFPSTKENILLMNNVTEKRVKIYSNNGIEIYS